MAQSGSVHATHAPDALQLSPAGQVPHETLLPQPLETVPHVLPWQALAFGVQHAFFWHVWSAEHVFGH